MQRLTLGRMQNPVRGLLHGAAAVASLAGLALLIRRAWGSGPALVGATVFGLTLVVLYTVSALYHSVPWSEVWKARLQRLDHSNIYLVVAGTFTPFAIAALDGASLVISLTLVWGIAAVGIVLKTILHEVKTGLSVTLQMTMGWLAVVWLPQILDRLGLGAVLLIVLGGVSYTVGMVVFMTKRPRLLPGRFSYHELFHVLVVTGSALHFLAIAAYALPAIA